MYLTAVSRFLPQPVWAVYQAGAGAAPWAGVDAVAQLTPPEDRATFHHQTSATDRQPRLLVLDQAETVRPDAALKLRIMRERASVAVLAAAAGQLDPRCRDGFLTVTVDESPKQTELILAEQRKQQGVCRVPAPAAIQARHHAAQRLLERLPVAIPFADRIVFPASRVRHRDEQRWFLSLIAASALLHQRQRRRENQVICASEADFDIVRSLTAGLIGIAGCSIGPVAERLLQAMWASGVKDFTLPALADLFPNWSRWTFRAALQDLTDFGHLTTITERLRGGRSQRRHYALNGSRQSQSQGITLLKVGAQTGKLAETGGDDSASLSLGRTGT
jgi:hypothetical protein